MFLFTSLPQPAAPPKSDHPLARPIQAAADATGVPFDYLMTTAKRESNLNPNAKASTSSATGLFQFIEQTWLGLIKQDGPQLGLENAAESIQRDGSGRYQVPDAQARRQILAMREDPELSARLAGVFTQKNKNALRQTLGRDPSGGELYIAHFLGAQGAKELIAQAQSDPERPAVKSFPDAASVNRSIFFDEKGRSRSTREVYARLVSYHDGAVQAPGQAIAMAAIAPSAPAAETVSARSPLALAAKPTTLAPKTITLPRPGQVDNAFHGLYRGGADSATATALRRTWTGFAEARLAKNAPSFFPRDGQQVAAITPESAALGVTMNDATAAPEAPLIPIDAPLPPRPPGRAPVIAEANPLDLSRYLKIKR